MTNTCTLILNKFDCQYHGDDFIYGKNNAQPDIK